MMPARSNSASFTSLIRLLNRKFILGSAQIVVSEIPVSLFVRGQLITFCILPPNDLSRYDYIC